MKTRRREPARSGRKAAALSFLAFGLGHRLEIVYISAALFGLTAWSIPALMAALAGDIFGKTPIWRSIWIFKALYYFANVFQPQRAFMAWKQRRFNIRKVDDPAVYTA